MTAVEQIVARLGRHPELAYHMTVGSITVEPPGDDGFSVSLSQGVGEWIVAFDGWHDRFTSEDEALNCFAFGLSDRCRLRVHLRGSFAYRWTLEARTDGGWWEESTVGRLFFPFWRRLRIVYRQNGVIRDTAHDT